MNQEEILKRLAVANAEYKKARRGALDAAKRAAEAQVAEYRRRVAVLALDALGAGASLRQIGLVGLGTKNYDTVRQLIGEGDILKMRGEVESDAASRKRAEVVLVPLEPTGEGEGDRYRLILDGSELDAAKIAADWTQLQVAEEHRSAVIERHPTGAFVPVTEAWLADISEQHPVVAWLMRPENREKVAITWKNNQEMGQ